MRIFVYCLIFIGLLFWTATKTIAQVQNVELANGQVAIEIGYYESYADSTMMEFLLHGDCYNYRTGRLPLKSAYQFACPSELSDGFLAQQVVWHGFEKPGGMVWTSQTSTCYRSTYQPRVDTVKLTPISIDIPSNTYQVDWYKVQVNTGTVDVAENAQNPGAVNKAAMVITNAAGYVMDSAGNLPQGIYFAALVLEWQGMYFFESEEFFVD